MLLGIISQTFIVFIRLEEGIRIIIISINHLLEIVCLVDYLMVLILDFCSIHYAKIGVNQAFRFV